MSRTGNNTNTEIEARPEAKTETKIEARPEAKTETRLIIRFWS